MPAFNTLTISDIRPQPDGVALSFSVPSELTEQYRFLPGQYLTLRAEVNGEDIRRSYSICSNHNNDTIEVGIKRVEDGRFSNYASTLKVGDQCQVMTPQGRFTAEIGGNNIYLLVAAGSGITPCLSIIKSVLSDEPESHIALIYGNRNTQSIMFREDLDDLKNQFNDRFMLAHVLTGEKQDADIFNGRIDAEKLSKLKSAGLINPTACNAIYLCGPKEMIDSCSQGLIDSGVAKDKVKFELFTSSDGTAIKPQTKKTKKDSASGTPVTIILDGAERVIKVDNETVLAAAQRAGLDLPFSCAGGMCSTCRCKVTAGDTQMDLNFSLADWEIEAGFTLACQTRPHSDDVVLDFDFT